MLLMLVRLTLHHLVHPRLAAGDVEVAVVSEALLAHQGTAAARPGGMAYLVIRRHAVDWMSPGHTGRAQRSAARGLLSATK